MKSQSPFKRGIYKYKAVRDALRAKKGLCWLVGLAAVLLLPLVFQVLIEFVRVRSVTGLLPYLEARTKQLVPGWLFLVGVYACITLATARPWAANLLLGAVSLVAGYANFYKLTYRGDPVVPRDLYQMGEAAVMAGEMSLGITREVWVFAIAILLSTLVLLPFRLPYPKAKKGLLIRIIASVLTAAYVPVMLFGYIGNRTLMLDWHDVYTHSNTLAVTYYRNSFVTSFLYLAANSKQTMPQSYTAANMQTLAAEVEGLGSEAQHQPDIIIVLLESFFDITQLEGTSYSEDLLPNYTRLAQSGLAGDMYMDKRTGGTAGFEFSVLTGFSLDLLPPGSVPYVEYVTEKNYPGLPSYYGGLGYDVVGIHPYIPEFYNRHIAYENLGFTTFIAEDDFASEDVIGSYVSDAAVANRIIQEYEARTAAGAPVFIQAVTMQNHSPYELRGYPEGYAVSAVSGFGEDYDESLSAYATNIRDADAMIGALCGYFAKVDRDVVLLFYGDHQTNINLGQDDPDLFHLTEAYLTADEQTQWIIGHNTPYLMWANYSDTEGEGGNLAPHMLFGVLAATYDVQAPALFHWLGQGASVLGGNVSGYALHPDGSIDMELREEETAFLEKEELLQYDIMFGKGYAYDILYGQPQL